MSVVSTRFSFLSLPFCVLLIALAVLLFFPACGQFFPPADQIVSLQISPLNSVIMPNATQQYTATATFGNNTTGDATNEVTWASSATNIASINTSGLATAVALGTTTISASSGSVRASTGLTVSNKTVTSVNVTPSSFGPLISGQTQQLAARANFSDSTNSDVTNSATWNSSDTTIATVSSTGLVTAVSTGSVTITATYGGQTGNSTGTVQ